jgi:hypothetical protein
MRVSMTHKTESHSPVFVTRTYIDDSGLNVLSNIYGTNFSRADAPAIVKAIRDDAAYSEWEVRLVA